MSLKMKTGHLTLSFFISVGVFVTRVESQCHASSSLMEACTAGYAKQNQDAKNVQGDVFCNTDILKDRCGSFLSLSKCLGSEAKSSTCEKSVMGKMREVGFLCTYKEIEKAVDQTTCDAPVNTVSLITLGVLTFFTTLHVYHL